MFLFSLLSLIASREHRVLALLSEKGEKEQYQTFFNDLTSIGCKVTYRVCNQKVAQLERFGQHLFDTVVILCSKSTCIGNNGEDLNDFLDQGCNAIVFNSAYGNDIQEKVYRHLNLRVVSSYKISDVFDNNQVTLRKIVAPKNIVPNKISPLIFEGGFSTIERPNDFRFPIVVGGLEHKLSIADRLVYSQSIANEMIPICAFQARTAGRVIVINSVNFASDEIYNTKVTMGEDFLPLPTPVDNGNRQLMKDLQKWVTHYHSHVKVDAATHYAEDTGVSPVQYHIKQNIVVLANLSYVKDGEWLPYESDDVQVEVFMLGTFVRRHMKRVAPGQYTETLMLPDRAGNYWIKVFTGKEGWMNAREEMAIAVRPLAIREKEKFLDCAKPYQVSMMLTMAAAFLASVHFLYHKPSTTQ
ncbi:hypothetical protein TRFO_07029 [Tritrichomonas foetus]|uniref:Dolichyl-diphosphooligosaccharide--protein glycosyltransferase 48 kDa subunit n=1 Tax=Tritrichomonas foetus TaxID=1144522 RepID=A0A1J4JU03_9EUKA|nr:hypothetical protein TRFO_07029 [Tritrichomonas foetus]|eukprot:OHT02615.1 hypothetical protein TRFO_07029 [Tritrichomonas foetus]